MAGELQRQSVVGVGLPFLRGGILPTGANLDTALERQYITGLAAIAFTAPPVGGVLIVQYRRTFRGVFSRVQSGVN